MLLIGEVRNVVKPGFAQSLTSDVKLIRGDPSFPTRPRAYWLSGKGKEEEKTSRNFFRIQHQSDRRKWQSFHALTLWQVSLWWMFGGTLHREEGKSQQVWFPDWLESHHRVVRGTWLQLNQFYFESNAAGGWSTCSVCFSNELSMYVCKSQIKYIDQKISESWNLWPEQRLRIKHCRTGRRHTLQDLQKPEDNID